MGRKPDAPCTAYQNAASGRLAGLKGFSPLAPWGGMGDVLGVPAKARRRLRVEGVNWGLAGAAVAPGVACAVPTSVAGDAYHDSAITINEILTAVNAALKGRIAPRRWRFREPAIGIGCSSSCRPLRPDLHIIRRRNISPPRSGSRSPTDLTTRGIIRTLLCPR